MVVASMPIVRSLHRPVSAKRGKILVNTARCVSTSINLPVGENGE
jgi:hypothetical protein